MPSSFATTDSLKTNVFESSQRPAPGSPDAGAVNRQVDRHLQRGQHLGPDHLAAALPGAEPHPVDDGAAADDEPGARQRDEVLQIAVGPDRRHGRLDVVDADAVVGEHLVVLVELRLQPPEVGVACARRVVVLPLLRVLVPDLVLGRTRDEHLAQRADPLGAPATPPDLLDLVVEVGLVEQPVLEGLAALEPRERLEHSALVVCVRGTRRGVLELDGLAVGGTDAERNGLARGPVAIDRHRTSSEERFD